MNALVVPLVEGVVENALKSLLPPAAPAWPATPSVPGAPPPSPMVAPPNLTQPDALVMMSLVLSIAVPASLALKAIEEHAQVLIWSALINSLHPLNT